AVGKTMSVVDLPREARPHSLAEAREASDGGPPYRRAEANGEGGRPNRAEGAALSLLRSSLESLRQHRDHPHLRGVGDLAAVGGDRAAREDVEHLLVLAAEC